MTTVHHGGDTRNRFVITHLPEECDHYVRVPGVGANSASIPGAGACSVANERQVRYGADRQLVSRGSRRGSRRGLDTEAEGLFFSAQRAMKAGSPAELGRALAHLLRLARRTQGDVVRYDAEHGKWLSRSTVSRMVQGTVVCRHYEQIEAFVAACGAEEYTEVWVSAWARVRDNQRTSGHTLRDRAVPGADPADDGETSRDVSITETTESGTPASGHPADPLSPSRSDDYDEQSMDVTPAEASAVTDITLQDRVLLDVHVRVTQEHIRAAALVLVAMGCLSGDHGQPDGETLAAMAISGAAGLALLTHIQERSHTDPDRQQGRTGGDVAVNPSVNSSVVWVTTPAAT